MSLITIDTKQCKKDGICIEECPFYLIKAGKDAIPEVAPDAEQFCLRCGHCLAVCPTGAITLENVTPESCETVPKDISVNGETMSLLVKTRRSVRVYKKQAVPREMVEKLMDMVRYAPTARNLQPVCWLVVDDANKIHQMAKFTIEWLQKLKILPDIVSAWDQGHDIILRDAPVVAVAHAAKNSVNPAADCAIACATLELTAHAMGLGGCWAGYFMRASNSFDPLKQFMNLPDGHRVYAALMLGYPGFRYHRIPPRQSAKIRFL